MANTSNVPPRGIHEVRAEISKAPQASNPRTTASDHEGGFSGSRKLVRPTLSLRAMKDGLHGLRSESPLLTHQTVMSPAPADEASHAEAFYFQKQVQMQTLMAFVLEDGEVIEGYIEWYDRYAIKVRNGSRALIYKSAIKYLYKVGESYGQQS
jgi:sRNA-binding regulator protein Hfq